MRLTWILAAVGLCALGTGLPLGGSAAAQTSIGPTLTPQIAPLSNVYRLRGASSFVEGCFDPCACPISLNDEFRGTFRLQPTPSLSVDWRRFEVSEVNWLVGHAPNELRVTGSGVYRVSRALNQHEMTLDLQLDDGPVTTFDSGIVPGGGKGRLPKIVISIDMADQFCFDQVFHIAAAPTPRSVIEPYVLDEGTFQEGCLPPCLCPLFQEQPVLGNFDLVPLGPNVFGRDEYAVINVDWAILPPQPSPLPAFTPVSGYGIYQVDDLGSGITPVPPMQRMLLDLSLGGEEDRWDSGQQVAIPNFPTIDLELAINDFFCFERIFDIVANPE